MSEQIKALENGQECLECDCYLYCTMDTCILDIDDEPEVFEFTDREEIEYFPKKEVQVKID